VLFNREIMQTFLETIVSRLGSVTKVSKAIRKETFLKHYRSYFRNESFMQLQMVKQLLNLLPRHEKIFYQRKLERNIQEIKMSRVSKSIKKPKFPLKITPLFILSLANVLTEGYVERLAPTISYTNKELILHKEFNKRMQNVFGNITPSVKENKNEVLETRYPTIVGVLIEELIGKLPTSLNKIPRFLSNLPSTYQKMFLRSLFDEEGYISPEKYQIGVQMKNLQIIKLSKILLSKFGIRSGKIGKRPQRTGTILHEFRISGRENLEKFKKKIGLTHPKKVRQLNKLLNQYI
jgi:hypothetical protein